MYIDEFSSVQIRWLVLISTVVQVSFQFPCTPLAERATSHAVLMRVINLAPRVYVFDLYVKYLEPF